MKSPQAIFLIIIVAVGLIMGGYLLNPASSTNNSTPTASPVTQPPADPALIHNNASPLIGKKDAKVKIVVFSDFLCPYCKTAHDILNKILENQEVSVEVRNFIVHENSRILAQAAEAANKQGKYKQMSDAIFADGIDASESAVRDLARKLELDTAQFDKDLNSDEIKNKISKDEDDAIALGLQGTPSVFLDNEAVENFNNLESLVKQKL